MNREHRLSKDKPYPSVGDVNFPKVVRKAAIDEPKSEVTNAPAEQAPITNLATVEKETFLTLGDPAEMTSDQSAAPLVPASSMIETTSLTKYDAACRALAEASKVDEAKAIRDKAEAVRVYAKQAKNFDLERQAIEIRLRAERRTGELLIETKVNGQRHDGRGNNPGTKKLESPTVTPTQKLESPVVTPTLTDLGISKRQSADWQKMAEIPAEEFEAKLTTVAATNGKATTAAILRDSKPKVKDDDTQASETAQRLQDECTKLGMNVEISPSRESGKFNITYRNLSEAEIQQAIGDFQAAQQEAVCS